MDTPSRRPAWGLALLVLAVVVGGGAWYLTNQRACDDALLRKTAAALRQADAQDINQIAAEGLVAACDPPGATARWFLDAHVPATPPTRQELFAGPGWFEMQARQGVVAEVCQISRFSVDSMVHDLLKLPPEQRPAQVYRDCNLERVQGLTPDEVRSYAWSWPALSMLTFLDDAHALEDPDARLLFRSVFLRNTWTPELQLPVGLTSPVRAPSHDTLSISATRRSITIDGKTAVQLDNGRVPPSQMGHLKETPIIQPLYNSLSEEIARHKQLAAQRRHPYEPDLALYADRSLPSRLLVDMLVTTQALGHDEVQMIGGSIGVPDALPEQSLRVVTFKRGTEGRMDVSLTTAGLTLRGPDQAEPLPGSAGCADASFCHALGAEEFAKRIETMHEERDRFDASAPERREHLDAANIELKALRDAMPLSTLSAHLTQAAKPSFEETVLIRVAPEVPLELLVVLGDTIQHTLPQARLLLDCVGCGATPAPHDDAGDDAQGEGAVKTARFSRGAARVASACDKDNVLRTVGRGTGAIRYCYEKTLKVNPSLSGEVVVDWTVSPKGRVTRASISRSTLRNTSIERCMVRVVKRWRFAPTTGEPCVISYPFLLGDAP